MITSNLNLLADAGDMLRILIQLAIIVLIVAGLWKTFEKAGHPGWAAIIPIYNLYILCKIAGRPGWWVILFLIPFVNLVIAILVGIDVAKNFGKGAGFGVGLALLGFIFYPILGFSDARYLPAEQAPGFPVQPAYGTPPPPPRM
ncbi:MAG TPA: DUF5684 domain-containing protein [Tepidisphaeraceae bacterium]|jgi:hypothetical protein|nr:DUF5684 domain-containing protein [Tepidisphaeraceae bacterium]